MGKCLYAVNLILFLLLDIFLPFLMGVTHVTIFCQSIQLCFLFYCKETMCRAYCKSMKYRDALPIVL